MILCGYFILFLLKKNLMLKIFYIFIKEKINSKSTKESTNEKFSMSKTFYIYIKQIDIKSYA